jgi:hypothetical protein
MEGFMFTFDATRSPFGKRATAVLLTGAFLASLGSPVAQALGETSCSGDATPTGILHVREFSAQDTGQGGYLFIIDAYAAMSQEDAQRFVENPAADIALRADDADALSPKDNVPDLLRIFPASNYFVTPEGLGFRGSMVLSNDEVNEDKFPGQDDEIYANVELADIRYGNGRHRVESCRLHFAL